MNELGPSATGEPARADEVFFSARFDHRAPGRIKVISSCTLCSGAVFVGLVLVGYEPRGGTSLLAWFLAVFAFLVFLCALSFSWNSLVGRVDVLVISARGVMYGRRFWRWQEIREVRFTWSKGQFAAIKLWLATTPDRGGWPILFDRQPHDDLAMVVNTINMYLDARGLRPVCTFGDVSQAVALRKLNATRKLNGTA